MDADRIANFLVSQGRVVMDAPVPFIAVLLFLGWLIWWFVRGQYETRIANAKSMIELLERQIDEYKQKLLVSSPDEARAVIDALKTRIDEMIPLLGALGPRRLTPEQRQAMTPILDAFEGSAIDIESDVASPDGDRLARGLETAFRMSSWIVNRAIVMGSMNLPLSGIGLQVGDPNNLTKEQRCIARALEAAGLEYDVLPGFNANNYSHGSAPAPVAGLVLTRAFDDD